MLEKVIAKTDKRGKVSRDVHLFLLERLMSDEPVIMPVDGIYCTVGVLSENNLRLFQEVEFDNLFIMVRDYRDLEKYSKIGKREYDFLHRLWPDDVYVKLHSNTDCLPDTEFYYYIPKIAYMQNLLNSLKTPLLFSFKRNSNYKPFYKPDELDKNYCSIAKSILILREYCKEHLTPTFIDIRHEEITIVNRGRVAIEDIKSLYYL